MDFVMDIESLWVGSTIVVWVLALLAIYELTEYKESGYRKGLNWKRLLGGLFLAFNAIGFYVFYTVR
jgi:hypothetical protein